jgi:hypothetical protein
MSEINKPVEMTLDELDSVAGGAVNALVADNINEKDAQFTLTSLGAKGGITNVNAQETEKSVQSLDQFQATGDLGVPDIFSSK